jgi:hypothetical protein
MTVLWIALGVLYIVCLVTLGMATLRNGHGVLFFFGIFLPFLWIIGAMLKPAPMPRPAG